MLEIYVDADGCPVKDEVYRVAGRYQLQVWVVANAWLRVPDSPLVARVAVSEGLDRADDWIAERIGPGDIAVTADATAWRTYSCQAYGLRYCSGRGHP